MLNKKQLERAAALLDQIHKDGNELFAIMEATTHEERRVHKALDAAHYFSSERLGLDPEVFITPAQTADELRLLIKK